MSTEEDKSLGSIKLDVEDGRHGLWDKVKLAFKYVYENHFDDFDWFLKADDDTFVIVENLKEMLSEYDTNDPIHFGHHYKVLGVSFNIFKENVCKINFPPFVILGIFFWWCRLCVIKRSSQKICIGRHH